MLEIRTQQQLFFELLELSLDRALTTDECFLATVALEDYGMTSDVQPVDWQLQVLGELKRRRVSESWVKFRDSGRDGTSAMTLSNLCDELLEAGVPAVWRDEGEYFAWSFLGVGMILVITREGGDAYQILSAESDRGARYLAGTV